MDYKKAIEALRLEGEIEIIGNPRRAAEFFDGIDVAISTLKEIQQYKQLGTLEEVREAVKRNKEKKVIEMVHGVHGIFDMGKSYNCPTCGSGLRYRYSVSEPIDNYCAICGQRIGWSGEDD